MPKHLTLKQQVDVKNSIENEKLTRQEIIDKHGISEDQLDRIIKKFNVHPRRTIMIAKQRNMFPFVKKCLNANLTMQDVSNISNISNINAIYSLYETLKKIDEGKYFCDFNDILNWSKEVGEWQSLGNQAIRTMKLVLKNECTQQEKQPCNKI